MPKGSPSSDEFLSWADKKIPGYSVGELNDDDILEFLASVNVFWKPDDPRLKSFKSAVVRTLLSFIGIKESIDLADDSD